LYTSIAGSSINELMISFLMEKAKKPSIAYIPGSSVKLGRREANDIDHVWYRIVNIGVQNKAY